MSVDATELRRVVERLAEERPDFVYHVPDGEESCLYTHKEDDGTEVPGCIIGTGLFELGKPIPYSSHRNRTTGVASLIHYGIITGSSADEQWLINVQNEQDSFASWSEAVAEANLQEVEGDDER